MEEQIQSVNSKELLRILLFPLSFVLALWVIHFLQVYLNADWGRYGIFPRETGGLWGIVLAPLIHADWQHLFSNSLPLLVASSMIWYFYPKVAVPAFWLTYLLTGASVWLMARPVYHIGASGVVYGLVTFIAWSAIFRKNRRSIALATIIMVLYGGMTAGVFPEKEGISWESHLLGALCGIFTAYFFKEEIEEEEIDERLMPEQLPYEQRPYFLPRDAFEKTRLQRKAEEEQRIMEEEQRRREEMLRLWLEATQQKPPSNDRQDPDTPGYWYTNTTFS